MEGVDAGVAVAAAVVLAVAVVAEVGLAGGPMGRGCWGRPRLLRRGAPVRFRGGLTGSCGVGSKDGVKRDEAVEDESVEDEERSVVWWVVVCCAEERGCWRSQPPLCQPCTSCLLLVSPSVASSFAPTIFGPEDDSDEW